MNTEICCFSFINALKNRQIKLLPSKLEDFITTSNSNLHDDLNLLSAQPLERPDGVQKVMGSNPSDLKPFCSSLLVSN